jgi:TonB family protein
MYVCGDQHPAGSGPCAEPPKAKSGPRAEYTEEARQAHAEGTVVLKIVVKADGTVDDIRVIQPLRKGLDNNAMDAVRQWKFAPATYQGKPVAVYFDVGITFRLEDATKAPVANFNRRQQCAENLGYLRRAAQVSNAGPRPSFDLADCLLELGRENEAIHVLQDLADFSHSPSMWNNVAYHLATHQVALETAVKWGNEAVISQSREVHNTSHNHLSTDHLIESRRLITFWDTLGWVYFMRDDFTNAEKLLAPGFAFWQDPSLGQHLAATYEKMGRKEDAIRAYAMTIAAENRLSDTSPEMLAQLKTALGGLVEKSAWSLVLKQGETDLDRIHTFLVPNSSQLAGTADFLVAITATQIKEARQVSGDSSFKTMADALRSVPVKYGFPDGADLIFTERGRMKCDPGAQTCDFVLMSPPDAITLAGK